MRTITAADITIIEQRCQGADRWEPGANCASIEGNE